MVAGRQPWQALSALPAWQLTQVPRPARGDDGRLGERPAGDGMAQRAAELVSAYCRSAPVAVAWLRERPGGPVRVMTAGPGIGAGSDSGQDVLTLPAGARGQPLPGVEAARLLAALPCWIQLAGVCDVLLADENVPGLAPGGPDGRPSLEDGLLSAWLGPFGWLLLAEPVDTGTLEELTSQVALAQLEAQRSDSPRAKLAERRAAARHAELRQAASTGLWRVHLLAGAATPQQAAQVAGLLRASTDLASLPYALLPARPDAVVPPERNHEPAARRPPPGEPDLRWAAGYQGNTAMSPYQPAPAAMPPSAEARWPSPQPSAPFYASTALVAALARTPAREVPGLRLVARPDFDLTPETGSGTGPPGAAAGPVRLGEVLDWNRIPCGELAVPQSSLNRHVFVCGATGSGKSQTVRHLLESATGAGIPWLVIEPAKAEYRLMAARLPGVPVVVIRPGDLDVAPASINPLEPAAGPDGARFPLQAHADLVRALFLAAFEADEPFPQVLAAALARCYEQAGWDLVTGEPSVPGAGYPALADLQAAAMSVVEEAGYGREVTDNVRGFVAVRIGSLRLGTAGRFLGGGHPLDFARLLGGNAVIEIEDCGDDTSKAFLTGAMLIRLTEHLRMRARAEGPVPPGLRHLTVIEEAHRLLRQPPPGTGSGPAAHAVEMFAGLLAEIRAYGEGLVIAEQIPAKLIPDAIKNTAVKIVHRLPAQDDRDTVGATMNLTPAQSAYLVTLPPGEAAVHADGMDHPILARMPDGTARETGVPAQAASPAHVVAARSASCGPDCQQAPCTLRQIRAAETAATRDPRITLWAELAVVAHLTGWFMPMLGPGLAADLTTAGTRLADCALAQAADHAVASRTAAIATRISGPALAAHVTAAMRAALHDRQFLCAREEPHWLAPAYQWALLLDGLRGYERDHPGAGPHPSTDQWTAQYGRSITGSTCAEQIATVQRWDDHARRDNQVHILSYGTSAPSTIERALGTRASDPDWDQRLTTALEDFSDCPWALDLFRPPAEEKSS
jgi:hypothetical protein